MHKKEKMICQVQQALPFDHGRRAAFFDLDGTLIQGDSEELEARYRLSQGLPSLCYFWSILKSLLAAHLCQVGVLSISRQNKIYLQSYRGQTRDELARQAQLLFGQILDRRMLAGAVQIMNDLRQAGDLIVLVSATTRHLMLPFETVLKPDYVFCTDLEFDAKGRATGLALDGICAREKKQDIVKAFARENRIDLSASHAFSDHHSDIPFLSSVGFPEVVNPTKQLERYARKMAWPIHRFA